jgi:hypothetical protein
MSFDNLKPQRVNAFSAVHPIPCTILSGSGGGHWHQPSRGWAAPAPRRVARTRHAALARRRAVGPRCEVNRHGKGDPLPLVSYNWWCVVALCGTKGSFSAGRAAEHGQTHRGSRFQVEI